MHTRRNYKLAGISLLCAAALAACNQSGPAEDAGKKIDQSMQSAAKSIDQTADSASRKIGEVADQVAAKSGAMADKSGVAIDDAEITAKIKAAFLAEPGLRTLQISVDTVKGVVTLSGSVDTPALAQRAAGLAGAVAGVEKVENHLVAQASK
jgi:hyperosmotically inducible protein